MSGVIHRWPSAGLTWSFVGLVDDVDDSEGDEPAYLLEVDLFRDVGELGLECLVCVSSSGSKSVY